MTDQKKFPTPVPKKLSALKRQRRALLIAAIAVVVLAVAFALVWYFTTRVLFEDLDGSKYYAVKKDDVYILKNDEGDKCPQNSAGNYITAYNTEVFVDSESGKCKIVSIVLTEGEIKKFDSYYGEYQILLYPQIERYGMTDELCIQSIDVVNEQDRFSFVLNKNGDYEIKGNPGTLYDDTMLASLAVSTGYTNTMKRLDIAKAQEKNSDGSWKYPEYDGFRQNGYKEYGLPEQDEDATTYFVITSKAGAVHKVIVGDTILSGDGHYVRYAGRDEVYILSNGSDSEYSYSMTTTVKESRLEDYVTPMAVVQMSSNNYFDVQDFNLSFVGDYMQGKTDSAKTMVEFSYVPLELRKGTFLAQKPYVGTADTDGFYINSYRVDDCLQNLQMMAPLRTVWLDNESENALDEEVFVKFLRENKDLADDDDAKKGVAFVLTFTFNAARGGESTGYKPVSDQQYQQSIWISYKTNNNTYYVYNEIFDMIVEVGDNYFEFLEWSDFYWIEANIFSGSIGYLEKVEFLSNEKGTTAGLTGVTNISFNLDNSGSDNKITSSGVPDTAGLKVYADYADQRGINIDVTLFRSLYTTLLYSSLEGMANCSEEERNAFVASGDNGAYLILRLTYNLGDGEYRVMTYRFYRYGGGRNSFVTINGNEKQALYCMSTPRVNKIVSDFGRILAGEAIAPDRMDGVS